VKLPDLIIKLSEDCESAIKRFFDMNVTYKKDFFREPIFGWFEVPHKEVFRFVTGEKIGLQKFPSEIELKMKQFSTVLDTMMPDLASVLFPDVESRLHSVLPFDKWGLIDVVHYNNKTVRPDNLNIVEHYDPGLLSFSILSAEPGFQFKNEYGEWVDQPNDRGIGMLWAGHALHSYDSEYTEGIHRVTVSANPRYSIWYEMATFDQERNDMLDGSYKGYNYEIELMEKAGYEPVRNSDGNIVGYTNTTESNLTEIDISRSNNVAVGFMAIEANTTGSNKVAIGYHAIMSSRSPEDNTAIGLEALLINS